MTAESDAQEVQRLQEIEQRYQVLDAGPWQWRQCYEVGSRVYWALESPKSAAEGRIVSYLVVLRHYWPDSMSEPVEDDPYLKFIAHSRDDIEWLRQRIAQLEQRIEDARNHSLVSSAPCPLCTYRDGVLLQSCQMHIEIFKLLGGDDNGAD